MQVQPLFELVQDQDTFSCTLFPYSREMLLQARFGVQGFPYLLVHPLSELALEIITTLNQCDFDVWIEQRCEPCLDERSLARSRWSVNHAEWRALPCLSAIEGFFQISERAWNTLAVDVSR